MYHLSVYFPGEARPRVTVDFERGQDVLAAIPELLKAHDGCERLEAWLGVTRLFSVDCHGNRSAG